MADKWPLADGNYSNAANWNDGTLPDVGDDVFWDGRTITIDQDIEVLSIRTTQRSGGNIGGIGNLSGNGNRTIIGHLVSGVGNVIRVIGWTGGGTLTINGNITGGTSGARGIWGTGGTYSLVVNGNIQGGAGNTTQAVEITSQLTEVTVNGNIQGGPGTISYGARFGNVTNGITVNGDCIGGSNQTSAYGLGLTDVSGGNVTINGKSISGDTRYTPGIRNEGNRTCLVRDGLVFSQDGSNANSVNPPLEGRCFRIGTSATITMRDSANEDRVFSSSGGTSRPTSPFFQQVIG